VVIPALLVALSVSASAAEPVDTGGPRALQVAEGGWFVEDRVVRAGSAELRIDAGYAFPLTWNERRVGWVWTGEGAQLTRETGLDLAGVVNSELVSATEPRLDPRGWTAATDVVWVVGPAFPAGGAGWIPLPGEPLPPGTPPNVVWSLPRQKIAEARREATAALGVRLDVLEAHGYPLEAALAASGPGWGVLDAHVPFGTERLAGNAGSGADGWLTTLRADPFFAPDEDVTVAFGTRYVFPPSDC
jgi:hypothetical protein